SGRGDPGLLQLGFLVVDVLARDRIKFLDQHLFRHVALVFRGRVEMTRAGGRLELDFLADAFSHDVLLCAADQASSPRARRSARTASMPFLSIVRMALVETRRRTQRFSLSTQNRRDCRLGKKRRLVLLFACETLLPTIGPLPVTWHTRAMIIPLDLNSAAMYRSRLFNLPEIAAIRFSVGLQLTIWPLLVRGWQLFCLYTKACHSITELKLRASFAGRIVSILSMDATPGHQILVPV